MNERIDFERTVAGHIASEGVAPPSDAFHDELFSRADRHGQRPRWLALMKEPPMRTNSRLAVGSPAVRVAAIIVATLLLTAAIAGAGIAGQRLLAAEETTFPTGTFVASEWSDRFVEFNEDGTCHWVLTAGYQDFGCTYVTDGDLFTETSMDEEWVKWAEYEPLTYRWDYDGEFLTFQPLGADEQSRESARYLEQPYRYVPDPRLIVIADYDIAAGTELLAGHTDLRVAPGADVPEDTLDDQDLATGRIAATDIAKDQPITPDLFATE